ncbi:hypothetical protein EIN_339250 [Entamoeba invadens IP1]|uniref:Uncharacterized protein n=1 Tax=Entamoeba invadens IP1 TaxID=370355 RepID=A0A0A1U7E0_ENTIV|nr:hypothetical protein EIN_339250 [Entamoeba invadens IP1]ELP90254.1 hypothetical protein EIN_339250 [Entamoeba invadens IP1]|eukprot:XP_004257025.1 hypothetical protein EIN_339250 [Entamoeba invadens IP1]
MLRFCVEGSDFRYEELQNYIKKFENATCDMKTMNMCHVNVRSRKYAKTIKKNIAETKPTYSQVRVKAVNSNNLHYLTLYNLPDGTTTEQVRSFLQEFSIGEITVLENVPLITITTPSYADSKKIPPQISLEKFGNAKLVYEGLLSSGCQYMPNTICDKIDAKHIENAQQEFRQIIEESTQQEVTQQTLQVNDSNNTQLQTTQKVKCSICGQLGHTHQNCTCTKQQQEELEKLRQENLKANEEGKTEKIEKKESGVVREHPEKTPQTTDTHKKAIDVKTEVLVKEILKETEIEPNN